MTVNWTHYKMQAIKAAQMSDYDEAERMWREALKEAEKYGEDDGRFALTIDGLAKAFFNQGKLEQAEKLYKKSLAIREVRFSPEHEDAATCANNLACVMFKRRRYKEAEELYTRALKIRERKDGKLSEGVANLLYQLGMVFHAQNRYERAEDFYKQALEIRNKLFGPDHFELVHLLKNYAHLLRKTNREPTAVQMEQFADSIEAKQK